MKIYKLQLRNTLKLQTNFAKQENSSVKTLHNAKMSNLMLTNTYQVKYLSSQMSIKSNIYQAISSSQSQAS